MGRDPDDVQPPDGATDEELFAWADKHEKPLFERAMLRAVQPHLGDVSTREIVDGRNPTYPGLTFDFALALRSGRRLAVEVAQVVPPISKQASKEAVKFAHEMESLLRAREVAGAWYFLFGDIPNFKSLDRERWLVTMQSLERNARTEIDGCVVQRHIVDSLFRSPRRIVTGTGYNYVDVERVMARLFGQALDENEAKLEAAARAGFDETHLIVAHSFPGNTDSWAEEVSRWASRPHPQQVWTVAFLADVRRLKPPES